MCKHIATDNDKQQILIPRTSTIQCLSLETMNNAVHAGAPAHHSLTSRWEWNESLYNHLLSSRETLGSLKEQIQADLNRREDVM